jgi:hypothetical protein
VTDNVKLTSAVGAIPVLLPRKPQASPTPHTSQRLTCNFPCRRSKFQFPQALKLYGDVGCAALNSAVHGFGGRNDGARLGPRHRCDVMYGTKTVQEHSAGTGTGRRHFRLRFFFLRPRDMGLAGKPTLVPSAGGNNVHGRCVSN